MDSIFSRFVMETDLRKDKVSNCRLVLFIWGGSEDKFRKKLNFIERFFLVENLNLKKKTPYLDGYRKNDLKWYQNDRQVHEQNKSIEEKFEPPIGYDQRCKCHQDFIEHHMDQIEANKVLSSER